MKYNFETLNIVNLFIKNMLYNTPLPLIETKTRGEFIYKGNTYIYGKSLIKCTKSGYLDYVSIIPSDTKVVAEYAQINKEFELGNYYRNFTAPFISRNNYYDTETHEALGEYLRCYRDIYEIDLMPYYNCFSKNYLSNIILGTNEYIQRSNNYKTIKIPIKFDKSYTIAINAPVLKIGAMFIEDNSPIIIEKGTSKLDLSKEFTNGKVSHYLKLIECKINTSFTHPFTFKIDLANAPTYYHYLYKYQKYLYLILQLDNNVESSLAVIEGNYSNNSKKVFSSENLYLMEPQKLNENMITNLSLLQISDGISYPFADRLVEYLLENIISDKDGSKEDIEAIQSTSVISLNNSNIVNGVWTPEMRNIMYRYLTNKYANITRVDLNGFIDKDTETFLNKLPKLN